MTATHDPFPANWDIEIDRVRLRRYLRAKWFLAWVLPLTPIAAFIGLASSRESIAHDAFSWNSVLVTWALGAIAGAAIGMTMAMLGYFLISHRHAARFAESLHVSVDGPFLRIRQRRLETSDDRRLHFRSIVAYTVVQDALMRRYGIAMLQMMTTSGGEGSTIQVPGVMNCLQVRDTLSEVDRLRENL